MRETINLDCGCKLCGGEEFTVTVDYAPAVVIVGSTSTPVVHFADDDGGRTNSIGPSLDVVLTCEGCNTVTNGFLSLNDMVEV